MITLAHEMRRCLRIVESIEEENEFAETAMYDMIKGKSNSYWISSDGYHSWIPRWGQHEDQAFNAFGEGSLRWSAKTDAEMQADYGHLFPKGSKSYISYTAVAMMHGWIRVILAPKQKRLYINLAKGKATPAAKQTVIAGIKAVVSQVEEYVVEYSGTEQNFVVPQPNKAIALINAR